MPSVLPLILNFDQSVQLNNAQHLDLSAWQDSIRFACGWKSFKKLQKYLSDHCPKAYSSVLTGSGDYHHISLLLLQQLKIQHPIQLIVCDNHPDNMRYPFGIHCGSWIYWASKLPFIKHIHVLGICSRDISLAHAWENHLTPLIRNKLTYWSIHITDRWIDRLNTQSHQRFDSATDLVQSFLSKLGTDPIYLSIDKDVLSTEVVQSNWDQGCFLEHHLKTLIDACKPYLIGSDITGEVSIYRYQSLFKRFLSALDGQVSPSATQLTQWQQQQNQLNQRLLNYLSL